MGDGMIALADHSKRVQILARVLKDAWAAAEPTHPVTVHTVSYEATFADLARAAVAHLDDVSLGEKPVDEVPALAQVLKDAWAKAEPAHPVTLHPVSYEATFADLARAIIRRHPGPFGFPEHIIDALQKEGRAQQERYLAQENKDLAPAAGEMRKPGMQRGWIARLASRWRRG